MLAFSPGEPIAVSRGQAPKRAYDTTNRDAAAAQTRERILEAARRLLQRVRPEDLSLADVAKKAGTSVRTAYRHFEGPEALVRELALRFIQRFLGPEGRVAEKLSGLPDQLSRLHAMLSDDPSSYRYFFALPSRSGSHLGDAVSKWTEDALRRVPEEHHDAVRGLAELVVGPYAWDTLHSHWNVPPERVTRASLAALQVLLDGLVKHPEWLDPEGELPPLFRAPSPSRRKTRK